MTKIQSHVDLWTFGAYVLCVTRKSLRIISLGNRDPTETLKLNSEKMILTFHFRDNFEDDDENGQNWKDVCLRDLVQ